MKKNDLWGISRSSGKNIGMIARLGLVLVAIVGSLVLAWALLGSRPSAHAIGTLTTTTTPTPTKTGTPTPRATPGPVNTTWYFAEGKVGQGFTEFLTIQNPDSVNACNVNLEYLLSTGGPVNKTLTIAPGTRWTEGVNNDLGTPSSSASYQAVSTVVTVTNASTCKGVVAERPIYFTNFKGISSGTEVLGATHTGTDYYFADVSSAPGYNSYITILNPPSNKTAATITASYYRGGTTLGTDTLTVQPGTRGTILPKGFNEQVATWVHSTVPVVVERPTYFNNISIGNAQHVSGAASVIGAPAQSTDWRFAEGYTGGGFQENLLLANFGTASASATVVLEYDNGSTLTNKYTINAHDLMSVDVNANTNHPTGTCAPLPCALSQSVSAEVTTSGGSIVAEREILFHYNHFDRGLNRTVIAVGGTDVVGQSGAAHATSYSFSEGYSAGGFDEWLTVQNPNGAPATITATLINGKGTVYQFTLTVPAHGRGTANITDAVVQHMFRSTDGTAGYQVSMTVQSSNVFVAERPMYWNAAGTQGASDIIGYIGG